ncbi:MAG TPA: class E sortase [Solirubrobacteraceae bacterium]|jgi:sortase A
MTPQSLSRPAGSASLSLSRPHSPLLTGGGSGSLDLTYRGFTSSGYRFVRALSWLLVLAGVLLLLDTGVTLVWQEPLSALYARIQQDELGGSLRALDRAQPAPVVRRALEHLPSERDRIALLALAFQHKAKSGSAIGRIEIPRIGASYVVVKGVDTADLQKGPGVYSDTNFPGLPGTTAIAGHRTTYLAPFRHIDELRKGNEIVLEMPYARFIYTVTSHRSVLPTDVRAAVANVGYSRLVLSACTPLFSAAERLLVFARLSRVVPEGAARRP